MNALDRVIAAVSPQTAVKRAAARRKLDILDSGYGNYGASHTKKSLAGWLYGGGSAKEDIQDNLSTLRQRCRDLYMGVPLATGALKTCRTNVIGSGLRLKSQIDYEALEMDEEAARDLERKIEREFSLWADSTACDLERLDNFYELQQLAFLNWLMSGDVIATLPVTKRANMPYDLRICLIEADRLSNPNGIVDPHIIGGVETNDAGEVVAYHISKHHPLSYDMTETGWTRVEALRRVTWQKLSLPRRRSRAELTSRTATTTRRRAVRATLERAHMRAQAMTAETMTLTRPLTSCSPRRSKGGNTMYEIQKDQSVPVKFFAGEYPVVTAVKAVATGKSVKQYEPVKLTDSGIEPVVKVAASEAVSGTSTPAKSEYENTTAGIYGIAATAAQAAEEVVVYLTGEFFADAITLPEGVTADTLAKAFRNIGIFLK